MFLRVIGDLVENFFQRVATLQFQSPAARVESSTIQGNVEGRGLESLVTSRGPNRFAHQALSWAREMLLATPPPRLAMRCLFRRSLHLFAQDRHPDRADENNRGPAARASNPI